MRISKQKKDRIIEQMLLYLYHAFPNSPYTAEIAREIARDEEFVKRILAELSDQGLVISIKKNNKGEIFSRRLRWRLSNKVYDIYKERHRINTV